LTGALPFLLNGTNFLEFICMEMEKNALNLGRIGLILGGGEEGRKAVCHEFVCM
jgi:hypothetical protein